ncbi:protein kinase domain-containing protein [Spirosoma spitsbergense]|uniref:protein kinase domain-containing protein n=1 Tax=Spirosoma spitsbergense TaxID=431554 RepID=UPI000382A22D|nr:protein kinase [Spirosoma spitsbergense]
MEIVYSLSANVEFIERTSLTNTDFDAGLLNKSSGTVLLLNTELTALLTLFREPASVAAAAALFAHQLDAPITDVQAVIQHSVDTFVQQGILVDAEQRQQTVTHSFPTLQPGTRIGDYTVLKELSATPPVGIYLVRNQAGKRFVLKKLFSHPKASRDVIRSQKKEFAYEFRILEKLRDCPLVSRLVAYVPREGIGVIDYFAGVSLRRFVSTHHDTLLPDDRIALFNQLLDGVASLHSRNVLHGDLHSSNVLVNKKKRILLIDFDLAFLWRDRNKRSIRYGGITEFIPPERLTDNVFHQSVGPPDFRAEVYQIGVLGYFIFHGTLPFDGHTWREQIEAIRHVSPVWNATAPDPVRHLIETALHKIPAQRFASAMAMKAVSAQAV